MLSVMPNREAWFYTMSHTGVMHWGSPVVYTPLLAEDAGGSQIARHVDWNMLDGLPPVEGPALWPEYYYSIIDNGSACDWP